MNAAHRFDNDLRRRPEGAVEQVHLTPPYVLSAAEPWDAATIFCNPPYGEARVRWVRRCAEAGRAGARVVLLIPAHTDTRIWHEAMETASEVLFIKGRVKFGVPRDNGRQMAASHPSCLIGWNAELTAAWVLGKRVSL